ncbi:unnamed protein product [Clonostachys byssicola]|uniref:Uncharacterized protein n=1 Tax=Clonostachys byssicola TaxID=160290 RepID=A0A9N9UT83_9HYPO|nr:unnamed protein product [Clonostachys byssicola]
MSVQYRSSTFYTLLALRPICIENRTYANSFGTQSERFNYFSAAPNAAVNHDFNLVEEMDETNTFNAILIT